MNKRRELKIVSDQYGKTTYTIDVANATMTLIENKAKGIFHFANEGVCSRYDFTLKIHEILRNKQYIDCKILPIKADEYIDNTPRPTYSVLSTQKYTNTTGKRVRHWEEALLEYLN